MTGTKGARLLPLAGEVAIHQIHPVARLASDTRKQFFHERQTARVAEMEKGAARERQQRQEIVHGVAAVRSALRLLNWRHRRLERLMASHADTASAGKSSS